MYVQIYKNLKRLYIPKGGQAKKLFDQTTPPSLHTHTILVENPIGFFLV